MIEVEFYLTSEELDRLKQHSGYQDAINALRSGKYTQNKGSLWDLANNNQFHACCLGVVSFEVDSQTTESLKKHSCFMPTSCRKPGRCSTSKKELTADDYWMSSWMRLSKISWESGGNTGETTFFFLNDYFLTHLQIADIMSGERVSASFVEDTINLLGKCKSC